MKLWGGSFDQETSEVTDKFNASISFDYKLYKFDIKGSITHAKTLHRANIITQSELQAIIAGLTKIKQELDNNELALQIKDEDIHMAIESRLIELIGDVGKKIHTARSRNDQVALDTRLYVLDSLDKVLIELIEFAIVMNNLAQKYCFDVMPGLTHLQGAQPISIGFHMLAYVEMFKRDISRMNDLIDRINYCPLGSGALAGVSYELDRFFSAKDLGFKAPSSNALDAVSDRDYIIESLQVSSLIGVHISRLAEELIYWNSTAIGYIEIDDKFATGSSIMPQKKNPDIAELARGKAARLIANATQSLILMKSLPLAYNKDTQEDKEPFFDTVDNLIITIQALREMMSNITFDTKKTLEACKKGYINATDFADYLVKKDIPFRDSHHIVGSIVNFCKKNKLSLDELKLEQMKSFSDKIENDVFEFISIENCVNRKNSFGGTSFKQIQLQIDKNKKYFSSLSK